MLSVKMIITMVIGSLLLLTYILVCCKKRNVLGLEVKSLVSVFYISTAVLAVFERPENFKYGLLIILGGILGLLVMFILIRNGFIFIIKNSILHWAF